MGTIAIEPADSGQADLLTGIACAAKRYWGYPDAWIDRWRDALTITPAYIAANACFVARTEKDLIGFSAIRFAPDGPWIDHLWVLPAWIGRRVGRQLFAACEECARQRGATVVRIESDPHAEEFYRRMGARTVARLPAPMDGVDRHLPVMEKAL
jgi:GNAT superfamily N-acetyltransferase